MAKLANKIGCPGPYEDVCWFDIVMSDIVVVQIRKGLECLAKDSLCLRQ